MQREGERVSVEKEKKKKKKFRFRKVKKKRAYLVSSGNVEDTVGIDVESDLNLRNTSRSRRNTRKFELSEQVVVLGTSTFSLEDLNEDTRLVVGVSGESLGLLRRDSGVTFRIVRKEKSQSSSFLSESEVVDVRGMSLVMTPPAVSIPVERGATSRRRRSWVFSDVSPVRIAA